MSKRVSHYVQVEIRESKDAEWVDISDLVAGLDICLVVGEFCSLGLQIHDCPDVKIEPLILEENGKLIRRDTIKIRGVCVSDHVNAYSTISHVKRADRFIFTYMADSDTIRINGQTPWEKVQ